MVEGIEPLLRGTRFVELSLFGLGGFADLPLHFLITDDGEVPWLLIRTARRSACDLEAALDHAIGDRIGGEVTDGPPLFHEL